MASTDLDDSFEDDSFDDDDDARLVDDDAVGKRSSLEKRRLIDTLLEEKRLARSLKDTFDDFDDLDDDFDVLDD